MSDTKMVLSTNEIVNEGEFGEGLAGEELLQCAAGISTLQRCVYPAGHAGLHFCRFNADDGPQPYGMYWP